jgi:hypothetical protein
MRRVTALLMVGLSVLATIWVYNRFSGKSVATLGAKTAA